MKSSEPGNPDESLRRVLKEWRTEIALPPRFQEAVWQRIEKNERAARVTPSAWAVIAHWISTILPRPALAASYVAVLLVIGVAGGWAQGREQNSRLKSELGERYVRILNPYQTPRQ